ncbi:hypothetical protein VNI00_015090 [Paramarasmius palmivorus]|uniref:FAD-binding domain-containing protein n=1 Tax=Paramarasmius palmivorus TaxID=297713 RepID=A0AAW0BPE9_9AGAR
MSTKPDPDVLIVGAGPSGLILALLLLRNNLSVRIIDKRDDFKVGQRGAGIHARTLELYNLLGILPLIEAYTRSFPLRKIYLPDSDQEVITQGPLMEELAMDEGSEYFRVNYKLLTQEHHQNILRRILKDEYDCVVETSTELVDFTQDANGVTATLTNHNQSKTETETARVKWLVGADGARSTVRHHLGLTFLGNSDADIGIGMVVGDIKVEDWGSVDDENWSIWGTQDTKLAVLAPYTHADQKMAFFSLGGAQLDLENTAKDRESILRAFNEITGKKGEEVVFGDVYTNGLWRSNIRMANKFQEGRVFIVGDAGHVHSFTGGQGMNSGVQDSFNLAWKLTLAHNHLSPQTLLDTYTSERLPLIAAMLDLTTSILRKDLSTGNQGIGQSRRGFEVRQLGITYRGSSILVDERYPGKEKVEGEEEVVDRYRAGLDGTVQAGDRAPEASGLRLVDGERMTSVYGVLDVTSHTVLLFGFGLDIGRLVDLVATYPKGLVKVLLVLPQGSGSVEVPGKVKVVVDTQGYAYKNYRVEAEEMVGMGVVIRPDGYIGAVVKDVSGLSRYFGKVFV